MALKYRSEISLTKLSPGPYIDYFSAVKGPICAKKINLCNLNKSDSVRAISAKK